MRKYKKLIVFIMLFAELMWILQPYSVLAKNNVEKKYNKKGDAEIVELSEAEIASLGDIEQEYQIILPDDSKHSVFLSEYLDEKSKKEKKVKITETTDEDTDADKKEKKDKKDKKNKDKKNDNVITVDNGIEVNDTETKKKEYKNKSNNFSGYLPESLDISNPIRLEFGKVKVTYIPMFYTFHNALTSNNMVTYYTDKRNTVFNYYFTNDSFKEEIVLLGPQDSYRFDYKITVDKGSLLEEDGRIFVLGNNKKKLFELKAPVAVDAVGNKLENLDLALMELDNSYNVTLTIDEEWVNDETRIFPIIIDPEFNLITDDLDTYINENDPNPTVIDNYYNSSVLKIGSELNVNSESKINRALFSISDIEYNTIQDEGTSINEAYIKLFTPGYIAPSVQNLQVCAFDNAVDYNTVTWANGNSLSSTCFPVTTTTETELIYHADFFSSMTQQEASGITSYSFDSELVSPEPTTTPEPTASPEPTPTPTPAVQMDMSEVYKLFDGDSSTGLISINNDYKVNQEIIIDLNEYIRPEEIVINFGGIADSSNEDLYIEFYNRDSEESLIQLVSNGMSAINEDGDYEVTMAFEPSTTLYNQVKLKINSNTAYGNPKLNEFQITKYQTEDNYVIVPLDTYLTAVINDSTMFNNGFYLRQNDEATAAITVHSNNNTEHKPEIYVDYESNIDVLETYPLDDIKLYVNPVVTYSGSTASFSTINFTGVATPIDSEVSLYLKKSEIDEYVLNGVTIDNITTDYIAGTEANFSSAGNIGQISYDFDELYQVEAEVTKNQVTSNRVSDTFIITKLQYYNSVADLAFFYGIDATTLREDNNISGDLDINSVVFIRNPKRNIGIPYTSASLDYITEMKDNDYLLGLNSFNEYYQDKVNVNTGNYYLSHTDMKYNLFGEEVEIKRVYNSMNSLGVQGFGENWDYNFNFRLINYDDNKLVFKKEDGQKIYFEKDGSNYNTQNNDYHNLSYNSNNKKYIIEGKDRSYTFNDSGQILKLVFNSGHEINYLYDNDRLTTVVLQNNDELKLSYDSTGLITSLEYVSVNADKKTTAAKVDYSYINDRLSEVSDPLGFTVNYQYDDSGRITSWTDEDNKTVDTIVYDDENRVTSITDGNGIVNTFAYYKNKGYTDWKQTSGEGQTAETVEIKRVRYNSSFKTELIEYENGSEIKKTYRTDNGQLDVETLMNGITLTYAYDSNQNITTITRSDGNSKEFTYDTDNNMLSEKDYNGNTTNYAYTNNLLMTTTYANTGTVTNTYTANNLLASTTDANNNTTSYIYDSKGRLAKVTYPNSETSEYKYNLMGYVSKETDTYGNNRIISRNYRNEVVYETSFEGDITQTFYNGLGNVLTYVDGNNHTTNFTYNNKSELTRKTEPNGDYTVYEYDTYGNLKTSKQYKPEDSENPVKSNEVNIYDQYNRLIKVEYPEGGYEKYQYNIEGELERKVSSTTNNQELVTLYRYDRFVNEIIQEHLPDGNMITRNYDANGNMISEIDITGSRTSYEYNSMNLLSKEIHDYGLTIDYTYDKNGNLLEKKETDDQTNTYYSSWSDWVLLSDSEYTLDGDYQTKTQYRSKDYETVWVNDYSYNDYQQTYNRRVDTDTWNWMHTTSLGFDWAVGYLGEATDTSGHPVDVYGYKDYEYTSYCEAHLTTDDGGTYCPKFSNHSIEYEFGGYPANFDEWQNEKIIQNENNIVETQTLYSEDGSTWSTSLNIYDEDTDLIDKEYLLKRKFYSTTGFSEWSDAEPPEGNGVVFEVKYLYREQKLNENTIRTSDSLVPGYTRDDNSKIIESKTGGYLHTNTLNFDWKDAVLGETVYNNRTIRVIGYKDYDYEKWGACSSPKNDEGGSYCRKAYYKYITYNFNGAGSFGEYQEDLIFDDETNQVESKQQYRYETRTYSDYQLLSDDTYTEESDIIKDEAYVRVRSQMIVPDDVNLMIGDTFDIMSGVSATDSLGNDKSSNITTNISIIDTSVAGSYDIEYRLDNTDLMVIRHVEVHDDYQATMTSDWEIQEASENYYENSSNLQLDSTENYSKYLVSLNGWIEELDTDPGLTPDVSGNIRIVESNPYHKTRSKSIEILDSATPPDSTYVFDKHDHTQYGDYTSTTIDWDSLEYKDGTVERGGIDNYTIKYRTSSISGYWGTTYHGSGYYAKYDHWRDGKHFIYKYGTKYSGYTTVYKVKEYTRTFTEMYKFYKYGAWTDWVAGVMEPDSDTVINQDLYRYIEGSDTGWIETIANPGSDHYEVDNKQMYVYKTRNTFNYNKFDYLDINTTKDLSTYFSYTNPVTGDVSSLVSIQVKLNGMDLSSELNGTSFIFDETGQYEITYTTTDGIEGKQTIDVRTVNNEHITTYTYNNMNQLASETDAEGNTVTYAYSNGNLITKTDEANNTENYVYNRNNQVIETNIKNSAGPIVSKMNYEYDGVGNKLSETDIYGNKTVYIYDVNNQLDQVARPVLEDGTANLAVTAFEYDAAGRVIKETNPALLETTTEYNDMNQVLSIKTKAPDESEVIEKVFVYDINGNITSLTENGLVTTFSYDEYGKKIKEVRANGLNIYYFYDSFNRLIEKTESVKTDVNSLDSTDRTVNYSYDIRNNLISETDVLGRTASYQYDVFGNLSTFKDFNGLFTETFYNKNNLPIMQIDARGNASYKYYNNLNKVVTEVAANGAVNKYEYNALGNVTKFTNGLSEETTYTYNMYGSILETTDALGNKVINTYTPDNKLATSTYKELVSEGVYSTLKTEEHKYNILGFVKSQSTTFTDPLTSTSTTVTIQNGYNAYGEVVQTIDGKGYETLYEFNDEHQLVKTTYPKNDGVIRTSMLVENTYNTKGELITVNTTHSGANAENRAINYEYNVFGQVTKTILDNDAFTSNVYSDAGLLVSEVFSNDDTASTADDYIKTYNYDTNGQLTSIVDNAGYSKTNDTYSEQNLETRDYNEYGDVVSITNQSGLVTNYSYDKYGNQISEVKEDVKTEEVINNSLFTTTEDLVTNISYDLLNRPVKTTNPNGLETTITYNSINQVISKSTTANSVNNTENYTLDMLGNVLTSTNSENETTTNVYDGLGRLVKTTLPNGEYTESVYDDNGNVVKVTKHNGATGEGEDYVHTQIQEFVYDEVNNLTQVKEHKTVDGVLEDYCTSYTYNKFKDLIAVQEHTGNTVSYSYDEMGNKTQTIYSNGSTIDYTYTKSNKLATKTYDTSEGSAFNQFTVTEEYEYYIDGKLKTKSDNPPEATSNNNKTEYYYYNDGQLIEHSIELSNIGSSGKEVTEKQTVNYEYNNMGQITKMLDSEGSTFYHYTDNGELSSTERVHENVVYDGDFNESSRTETSRDILMYEYDKYGNQTKIIYDDNSTVDYTYDSIGRMLSVTDSNGTTTYSYDLGNNKVTEELPNGIKTIKTYEFDQVTHLQTTEPNGQGGTTDIFEQTLKYDEAGNVLTEERIQNGIKTEIANSYNERSELEKSVQKTGTEYVVYIYGLSPIGNKTETVKYYNGSIKDENLYKTEVKAFEYNYMNQLVSATINGDDIDYFYDEYGSLIQENNKTSNTNTYYTYDLKNQLIEYKTETEKLEFEYDGSGNRIDKKYISIDGSLNETITDVVSYINDITKPNEEVISLVHNGTTVNYTYGLDRLYEGNEEYLHDSYGNVVEHASEIYEYTPYGELISGIIDGVNEYGYKGEVHDTESLQYLRARYYHTSLMQFISEDTYTGKDSNPLSQNRYTFVQNNPFKYSDPSGHRAICSQGFEETKTSSTVKKTSSSRVKSKVKNTWTYQNASKHTKRVFDKTSKLIEENSKSYISKGEKSRRKNEKTYESADTHTKHVLDKTSQLMEESSKVNKYEKKNKSWSEKAWEGFTGFLGDTGEAVVDIASSTVETTKEVVTNTAVAGLKIGSDIYHNGLSSQTFKNSMETISETNTRNLKAVASAIDDNLDNFAQVGKFVGYGALAVGATALVIGTGGTALAAMTGSGALFGVASAATTVASIAGSVGTMSMYALGAIGSVQTIQAFSGKSLSGEDLNDYQREQKMQSATSNITAAVTIGAGSIVIQAAAGFMGSKIANAQQRSRSQQQTTNNTKTSSKMMNTQSNNSKRSGFDNFTEEEINDYVTGKKVVENIDQKEPLGGAYSAVPSNGGQRHHMPADSVSPYSKYKGPVIYMETNDHMQTGSWGSSRQAILYREAQSKLIEKGMFLEAQKMDILDIQNKFGNKYDEGIKQMLDYTNELLK